MGPCVAQYINDLWYIKSVGTQYSISEGLVKDRQNDLFPTHKYRVSSSGLMAPPPPLCTLYYSKQKLALCHSPKRRTNKGRQCNWFCKVGDGLERAQPTLVCFTVLPCLRRFSLLDSAGSFLTRRRLKCRTQLANVASTAAAISSSLLVVVGAISRSFLEVLITMYCFST